MSLNGLDASEVLGAHQSTINDPGGWFLLKYVSRDGVELHGRGRGGVHEARQSIADYQEASPLYGLLIYRRRKVLIKYIPAGTSRVLQARTTVHFQDVIDRYSPYDTLLEITSAEGLNDTALAASFPLHTASTSISSNRLHEISEDAEDPGSAPRRATIKSQNTASLMGARQHKMDKRVDQIMRTGRVGPPATVNVASDTLPAASTLSPGKTSISSQILVREDSGKRSITSLGSPLTESVNSYNTPATELSPSKDNDSRASFTSDITKSQPPRPSISSQRPGTQGSSNTATGVEPLLEDSSLGISPPVSRGSDFQDRMNKALDEPFDFSYLEPKQKVKLGPRPVQSKRVTTTGVSALPAHYRPQQRKTDASYLSTASPISPNAYSAFPLPPIPPTAEYNPRPISRGSVKSLPSSKSTTMTPDKIRLMKAVELRKRQLRKSNPQLPAIIPDLEPDAPEVPKVPEVIPEQSKQEAKETRLDELRNAAIAEQAAVHKADSGIEMDYNQATEQKDTTSGATAPAETTTKSADNTQTILNPADANTVERPTEPESPATVESVEAPVDPATVEALKNDELRAEAEGYGAIPAESPDEEEPAYSSPRGQQFSPSSNYSGAADLPEADIEPAQTATTALHNATQEAPEVLTSPATQESKDTPVLPTTQEPVEKSMSPASQEPPEILTLPATPMEAEHPDLIKPSAQDSDDDDGESSNTQTSPLRRGDLAKRRRGIVEPLQLETQNELLSDEDLMDELQDATVQEARPMAVAKSPINAYFARRPSNQSLVSAQSEHSASARTVNADRANAAQALEKDDHLAEPTQDNHRSVSPLGVSDTFAGLRGKVGAGITKRFQALTESNRDGTVTPATTSPAQSVDGSPNERRRTHRSRAGSFKGRWGLGDRTSSTSTVASTNEHAATWSVSQDSNNRDSIHVRARIIRPASSLDTHDEKPDAEDAAKVDDSTSTTHLGPLDTSIPEASDTISAISPTSRRNRNFSLTPHAAQADDFTASSSKREVQTDRGDDASTIASNTTSSRTSRFFKRMSVLGGSNKRKSVVAPSSASQSVINMDMSQSSKTQSRRASNANDKDRSDMPPAAALGDLNVQFPDTLLWKRRWLTLDESGNLMLGIPQGLEHRGAVPRKHHLNEFKLPYIPDLDRQEIPHSICLDFLEDGTLQIACEDAMSQRQVLSMLKSYWRSWTG